MPVTTNPAQDGKCTACRGRGWKLRRSRRILSCAVVNRGSAEPARVTCPDCDGSGRAVS